MGAALEAETEIAKVSRLDLRAFYPNLSPLAKKLSCLQVNNLTFPVKILLKADLPLWRSRFHFPIGHPG